MPFSNIKTSPPEVKKRLCSVNMIYCLFVQSLILALLLTLIYYFIRERSFDFDKAVPIFFFSNSLLVAFNFIFIAHKMPQLLYSWTKLEREFDEDVDGELTKKTLKTVTSFSLAAFTEHVLSKIEDYEGATFCFNHYSTKFEGFTRNIIPIFFKVFDYNHFHGAYIILTCFFSTILWNFADIFLIAISFVISMKLKKFNRKIAEAGVQQHYEEFWRNTRLNYVAFHEQVKATSSVISSLLLLSLLTNCYFVCNQVLGALT